MTTKSFIKSDSPAKEVGQILTCEKNIWRFDEITPIEKSMMKYNS
jgi:hypothetical protein